MHTNELNQSINRSWCSNIFLLMQQNIWGTSPHRPTYRCIYLKLSSYFRLSLNIPFLGKGSLCFRIVNYLLFWIFFIRLPYLLISQFCLNKVSTLNSISSGYLPLIFASLCYWDLVNFLNISIKTSQQSKSTRRPWQCSLIHFWGSPSPSQT